MRKFLVLRKYRDTRSSSHVTVRITHPIFGGVEGRTEVWVCYLEVTGLDDGYCVPICQVDEIGAILGAVEMAHRILAPHEVFLQFGDRDGPIGSSEFPRILPTILSSRALERIDAVVAEEPPKKLKWPSGE